MASKKELRALITLAGKIEPSLQTAMMQATKMNMNMVQQSKKSASSMNSVWTIAKGVFTGNVMTRGLSMVTSGIRTVGSQGINLASDLTEVKNVVDTTFGAEGSKQINEWSGKALKAFGLSELQAKKFTGTMGAMLKSSGISSQYLVKMSEGVTGLAGDFASYYNLDHEEAFNKIRAGISGETEPLKELGINMSVANLEAFAMSKGIKTSYDKMDQASQTLLRYNYLMEQSKDSQNDFSKTLDTSYANQKRLFSTNLKQKMEGLWQKSLPMLTEGMKSLNKVVDGIDVDDLGNKISNGLGTAFNLVGHYGPLVIDTIKKIPPVIEQVYEKGKMVIGFLVNNWPVIGPVLAGVTTSVGLFATKFLLIPKVLSTIPKAITGIKTAITAVKTTMSTISLVGSLITSPFGLAVLAIGALVGAGIWLYHNWDWVSAGIVGIWQNNVMPFFNGIGAWFSGVWDGVVGGFKWAWNGVSTWFTGLWDGITGVFKGFINNYLNGFNFVIGALNKVQVDMPDWVPLVGGKHFGINIPLIPTFAEGGFTNQPSIFGEAGPEAAIPLKYRNPRSISILNQTAKAIGATGSGGGSNVTINLTINAPGGDPQKIQSAAQSAKEQLLDLLDEYFSGRPSFG